jgi:hypothetical protein
VERLEIQVPEHLGAVSGGTLHLEGFSEYVFENALVRALCGEGGSGAPEPICGTDDNVLATGTAMVQSPDVGLPGPFEADLAYTVAGPVRARLAVYATSPRDGGLVHLATREVQLSP